ncbi:MAG: hypothetical protein JXA89_15665 [Anaerolineae bacterium]|nr:hypothetical protein [Anaerolineae bacterium]
MRLSAKLLLLFVILATAPLAVVGLIAYENGQRTIEQSTFEHLAALNAIKEAFFERWIDYNEQVLSALAQRPSVQVQAASPGVATVGGAASSEVRAAYEHLDQDHLVPSIHRLGGYESLSILRAGDGRVLISTDKSMEGQARESATFFIQGRLGIYTGKVEYAPSEDGSVMYVSAPMSRQHWRCCGRRWTAQERSSTACSILPTRAGRSFSSPISTRWRARPSCAHRCPPRSTSNSI